MSKQKTRSMLQHGTGYVQNKVVCLGAYALNILFYAAIVAFATFVVYETFMGLMHVIYNVLPYFQNVSWS